MKSDGLYNEFINSIGPDEPVEPNYDLIDSLVEKYQEGDKNAAEELVHQMTPYMIKFFKIIRLGIIDLADKDSRKFITLFIENKDIRYKLKKAFQSTEVRNGAYQAALTLQSMCAEIPSEDLIQELIVILLTLAKRYEKIRKKVNFCGYLYNSFRFELSRRIKEIIEDPLAHRWESNIYYNDQEYMNDEDPINECNQVFTDEPIMILDDELGNSWIRGITCSDMFTELTPLQRIILRMSYIDGQGDTAIAERLGIHRNTIHTQRVGAEEILRQAKDDPHAQKENSN